MTASDGKRLIVNGTATSGLVNWHGGKGVFAVCVAAAGGAWNGATVSLQMQGPDGAVLLTVGVNTTLAANGMGEFELPPCQLQATVTGGPPAGLYANIARVPQ